MHMMKVLDEVEFLIGDRFEITEGLINQQSFNLFSSETLQFLSEVSLVLLKFPDIKKYPDVATFAFYCRKSNLNRLKRNHDNDITLRFGRGILFHISPGNIPVNFAYSLLAGLLTGNINIVRLPSKNFIQVNLIINALKIVLSKDKFKLIFSKRLFLVKYNRDSISTAYFSKICDVRIIWGGDHTINEIRKSQIPPKSFEVTFADRYSIAMINAKSYIAYDDKSKFAIDFYNDTYLFDQNACTSPHTIYWYGDLKDIEVAKNLFWKTLSQKLTQEKYDLQPILSIDKLVTFFSQSIYCENIKWDSTFINHIWRINNNSVQANMDFFKSGYGYFNEVNISNLNDIVPAINRKFQTLSYFGFSKEELSYWINTHIPLGIDRIVPIGSTMDFSLIWDGFDLVNTLSRKVQIL